MARCNGDRGKTKCPDAIFKCQKCQAVGCNQNSDDVCSNQNFRISKCKKCGTSGKKERVN